MPVSVIEEGFNSDSGKAERVLDSLTLDLLSEGWHFNTRYAVSLVPDALTNEISLPANTLAFNLSAPYSMGVVIQENKLYDLDNNTFEFTAEVKGDILYTLTWEQLPYLAQRYLSLYGGRVFKARHLGENELANASIEEQRAYKRLKSNDLRSRRPNILTTSYDSQKTRRMFNPMMR